MSNAERNRGALAREAPPGAAEVGAEVTVSPIVVLSRTFPARPSSIPDAHAFVRESLAAADIQAAPHALITEAILAALLDAAGSEAGTFAVDVRLLPGEAEVEVLSSPAAAAAAAAVPARRAEQAQSFSDWLSGALRSQHLSHQAAAVRLGVSARTVSRWVRGQTEPRLRDVQRLSDVFGPVPRG